MSLILERLAAMGKLPMLDFAEPTGMDRHGQPAWGPTISLVARAEKTTEEVLTSDGERVQAALNIWLPRRLVGTLPEQNWRVTYNGANYIIVTSRHVRTVDGNVSHHRYQCRVE